METELSPLYGHYVIQSLLTETLKTNLPIQHTILNTCLQHIRISYRGIVRQEMLTSIKLIALLRHSSSSEILHVRVCPG